MRYARIINTDFTNGLGVGQTIFLQGCNFHCKGCFNSELWDFNKGKEFTEDIKNSFLESLNRSYIKRVTFLGGEPLADENTKDVYSLIINIKSNYPHKKIWVYTGNMFENIWFIEPNNEIEMNRKEIIKLIDVLVDGPFVLEKRDLSLPFRGSSNQRIIDCKKSIKENKIITLYNS